VDIEVLRGDTATITLVLAKPDDSGTMQPFPIADTTHEVWLTVKIDPADPDSQAVIRKRMGAGDMAIRVPPNDHVVDVVIPAGETAVLDPGRYFYDSQVKVKVTSEVQTMALGRFFVLPDVTRAA
jgi:hypothetical protein